MKNYENEARERWGNTAAYHEHEQKTKNYTKDDWTQANDGLMAVFAELAMCKNNGASAYSSEAQGLVAKLHAHITDNSTPVPTTFSQVLGKCMLPTSDLRTILINTVKEQPIL